MKLKVREAVLRPREVVITTLRLPMQGPRAACPEVLFKLPAHLRVEQIDPAGTSGRAVDQPAHLGKSYYQVVEELIDVFHSRIDEGFPTLRTYRATFRPGPVAAMCNRLGGREVMRRSG